MVQEVWNGRLWSARPVVVVEHTPNRLVHWCPAGTRWKVPQTPPTRERPVLRGERFAESLLRGDWILGHSEWRLPSLEFVERGENYAVRVTWAPDGEEFWGWYVNIQEPFRETRRGIQMMDLMLDLVIRDDHTWLWKDEDEVALFVERGLFNESLVEELRHAGTKAMRLHDERSGPFESRWATWRPDPTWAIPGLPDRWDELS